MVIECYYYISALKCIFLELYELLSAIVSFKKAKCNNDGQNLKKIFFLYSSNKKRRTISLLILFVFRYLAINILPAFYCTASKFAFSCFFNFWRLKSLQKLFYFFFVFIVFTANHQIHIR